MSIREQIHHLNFGGFSSRIIASFLDFIILSIIIFCISKLIGLTTDESMSIIYGQKVASDLSLEETLFFILTIAYYVILPATSLKGTIGKLVMGLQIVNVKGYRISLLRSTGRYLASFVSAVILFAGFFMIIFHPEKRGLHDIIANTYVLKKNPR